MPGKSKSRKGKVRFPCGKCRKECESECLLCEVCNKWLHGDCEGLSKADFKKWSTIQGAYICTKCIDVDDFDYLRGMTRLQRAARSGISSLQEGVVREMLLIGHDIHYRNGQEVDISSSHRTDVVAECIMNQYTTETGRPVITSADGDCLFNSVSILLNGSETLSVELRYKTVLMMVRDAASIQLHDDKASILDLSPTYEFSTLDCARIGKFSSVWTIMALAKVIDCPLRAIYPPVNGEKDLAYRTLNTTFNAESTNAPLAILWTNTSRVTKRQRIWTPNHFVAVCERAQSANASLTATGKGYSASSSIHLAPSPVESSVVNVSSSSESHECCASPKLPSPVENSYSAAVNVQFQQAAASHESCDVGIVLSPVQHLAASPDAYSSMFPHSVPITSTPKTNVHSEWQIPKRRKKSSEFVESNDQLNLCNRFDSLTDSISESTYNVDNSVDTTQQLPIILPKVTTKRKRSLSPIARQQIRDTSGLYEIESDATNMSDVQESETVGNDIDANRVPINGPCRGKLLHDKFLTTDTLLGMFKTVNETLPHIPPGVKEGAYYFVNNTENIEREKSGQKREFYTVC